MINNSFSSTLRLTSRSPCWMRKSAAGQEAAFRALALSFFLVHSREKVVMRHRVKSNNRKSWREDLLFKFAVRKLAGDAVYRQLFHGSLSVWTWNKFWSLCISRQGVTCRFERHLLNFEFGVYWQNDLFFNWKLLLQRFIVIKKVTFVRYIRFAFVLVTREK